MMRAFRGSLWMARRRASRASASVTPDDLEQDATRLDVGDPPLGRTLTGTHAGLGGLLGERTVRVDVDPDLSATLDVAGHRDTSGLDLTVGHVGRRRGPGCRTHRTTTFVPPVGRPCAARVVLLAVLDSTWESTWSGLLAPVWRRRGRSSGLVAPGQRRVSLRSPRRAGRRSPPSRRGPGTVAVRRPARAASSLLVMSPL